MSVLKKLFQCIEWAPIFNVPWKRRREALAAFFLTTLWMFGQPCCMYITYCLLFHAGVYWRIFIIIYLIHIIIQNSSKLGNYGSGSNWFRSLKWWKCFSDYFPINVIKTVELPLNKRYIFACHPHGLMGFSYFAHFCTYGTPFVKLFPDFIVNLTTLGYNYCHPFYRELVHGWGTVTAKSETIKHMLKFPIPEGKARGIALCIGGAEESIFTQPKSYIIYVKNRKVFIKIAIETGTDIVPVFSFGENDIFNLPNNKPGTLARWFQESCIKCLGFVLTPYSGRGLFQYTAGLMPFRRPINTVFGTPICVKKMDIPSVKEINRIHEEYIRALERLFEEYKWKFVENAENIKLVIS